MQLQIGDRLTDSIGEWEVVGRPYTTNGGKNAHVRVERVSQPGVIATWMWLAYERIALLHRPATLKLPLRPPPPRPPDRRHNRARLERLPAHGGVPMWGGV